METTTTTQPRIADYVRPLTSRKWLILLAVIVATGGVYAFYRHKHNVYTASTLVFLKDPGDPVTGVPNPQTTDRQVQNEATLLDSRGTADAVKQQIGYDGTAEQLLGQVSITSRQGEDFVNISANGRSAKEAAAIANSFADEFASLLNTAQGTRIDGAIKLTRTQLAQLPTGPVAGVQRANLLDQLNRLELARNVPLTVARQINAALPPGGPSSPKPVRNAIFAFILSLIGAVAVAYGLERFDRRLKSPDEVEDAYAAPLLSVVPHTNQPAPVRDGEPALGPDFREPFWLLRTNLELASLDKPPRTLVVSSAMPGEGKSTVVRNLALAYREAGKRVVAVDLDLRHPTLARMFGTPPARGMTEVLRHEASVEDVTLHIGVGVRALDGATLQEVSRHDAWNGGSNGHSGNGNGSGATAIALLLSGARPANPPGVLASDRLIEVLNDLRERYDVVLIDSAPVLAVTDTVPLLRYADAALFVGRLGITTRDTAKRLQEFLARVPDLNLLGVVANDLSRLEAGAYGYEYGYYAYGDEAAAAEEGAGGWAARRRAKQTV